ncbi:MAG: SAM-dependent DNA methyltransferase [Deltaproteobacteria bacterium]|nr:SAM-dependent DNA methyltransferase [Deltaproteobacteria bacterium]
MSKKNTGANLGFEDKLWAAADKLCGNMDAAEYKHVILGLIFLKYISDAFSEKHDWLLEESANPKSEYYIKEPQARYGIAENRDEYLANKVKDDVRWKRFDQPSGNAQFSLPLRWCGRNRGRRRAL